MRVLHLPAGLRLAGSPPGGSRLRDPTDAHADGARQQPGREPPAALSERPVGPFACWPARLPNTGVVAAGPSQPRRIPSSSEESAGACAGRSAVRMASGRPGAVLEEVG